MNKFKYYLTAVLFLFATVGMVQAQEKKEREPGHTNQSKFKQMYEEFSTPNTYRSASGAPGPDYYQQQANYKMDIELDDANAKLYGEETITYINNSPDDLEFLWVQLDQNVRQKDTKSALRNGSGLSDAIPVSQFAGSINESFDGGFNIQHVKDASGRDIPYTINQTMMRVNIPAPLKSKEQISFSIKWWYNVPDHTVSRARSGYEYFAEDDNRAYVIAQFFPRMAVYSDVEGWQNHQFWGSGEFALPFGDYEVNITVPADHVLDATGVLQNRKEVFSKDMMKRYEKAKKSFDKPVLIVTQKEAEEAEKTKSTKKKTWKFKAKNVRDYGFATSRKFIWDMQNVKLPSGKTAMAVSMYPKEGNPLWEEYSTKAVAHTLRSFSEHTFDYPYPKAISVHAKNQGMEYPMICWNYGRPNKDGTYSDRTKYGMISVIIHEVGHNFFPMIVNSDERQWGWMDEGLDTFMQYIAEQEFGELYPEAIKPNVKYPSRRGEPSKIVPYMAGNQSFLAPIMSNPENVYQLGPNAYGKPATALNILRETVMGRELFDHAFRTYSQRWKFKHPTPEDFFRTMEDASAVDLDWYWRGWFYTTDYVDIGVKGVTKYQVSNKPGKRIAEIMKQRNLKLEDLPPMVFLANMDSEDYDASLEGKKPSDISKNLKEYMMDNFTAEERAKIKEPKFFNEVTFNKPGGIPMPLIVEYSFADGSTESVTYPPEIWRKNDAQVKVVVPSQSELTGIMVDPKAETADIDTTNNSWPKKEEKSGFDKFKGNIKG